jgi:hypothetical protein
MSEYPTRDSSGEADVKSDAVILGVSVKGYRHRPPSKIRFLRILLVLESQHALPDLKFLPCP